MNQNREIPYLELIPDEKNEKEENKKNSLSLK